MMTNTEKPVVHIWGAGVDKCLGMPLAAELLGEVAKFANGEGKLIAEAVRTHLPYLRFSFARYTGEQGETFAEKVLSEDSQALNNAKNALNHYLKLHTGEVSERVRAVDSVITALEAIRDKNRLDDTTLGNLAAIAGESFQPSGGDYIINPRGLHLVPVVRQAFRKTFQGLAQSEDLTEEERETLTSMALSIMNVEELLGNLFSGFYTKKINDQKQYLYVAWILWAYLRMKMESAINNLSGSSYEHFTSLPSNHHLITLNYTALFIPESIRDRVMFFHGDCLSYIRLDSRDLIKNDEQLSDAKTIDGLAEFIRNLPIDVEAGKVWLPGIIPPLSVKPIMCREHLETWYWCGQLIDQAKAIVVMGYSFNLADEHFNDLLRKRKGPADTKIIVINPDMDRTITNVCGLLGRSSDQLTSVHKAGFTTKQGGNLLFVDTTAEQITPERLQRLME